LYFQVVLCPSSRQILATPLNAAVAAVESSVTLSAASAASATGISQQAPQHCVTGRRRVAEPGTLQLRHAMMLLSLEFTSTHSA